MALGLAQFEQTCVGNWRGYCLRMSYRTLEVELENGQVRPSEGESLPLRAHALLTILNSATLEPVQNAGPSVADLAAGLCGIGNGKYTDLSTNKAHLDDFGR
jgi:hypothetical protein